MTTAFVPGKRQRSRTNDSRRSCHAIQVWSPTSRSPTWHSSLHISVSDYRRRSREMRIERPQRQRKSPSCTWGLIKTGFRHQIRYRWHLETFSSRHVEAPDQKVECLAKFSINSADACRIRQSSSVRALSCTMPVYMRGEGCLCHGLPKLISRRSL